MNTLLEILEILELIEIEDKLIREDAEMMASNMTSNLIRRWIQKEFLDHFIESEKKLGRDWTQFLNYFELIKESDTLYNRFINFACKQLGYRVFASMNYGDMETLPEKREFIFDPPSDFLEHYFREGYLAKGFKILLPNQPNENLTSIVLVKKPGLTEEELEGRLIFYIESGTNMPGFAIINGNEDVSVPIWYGSMPFPEGSFMRKRFKGHIEISVPTNLTYEK